MRNIRGSGFVVALAALAVVAVGCVTPPTDPPVACAPGTFSASGTAPCTPAPIGTYVPGSGATSPTACPPNTTTLAAGSTSSADCVQVPAFTWNQTFAPTVGLSGPFSRTTTGGVTGTIRFNCTGMVSSVGAGGLIRLNEVGPGLSPGPIAITSFPFGAFLPCGGTHPLVSFIATDVFEAGNSLRLDTLSLSFPPGTTLTVSLTGALGGGPTQVLDLGV